MSLTPIYCDVIADNLLCLRIDPRCIKYQPGKVLEVIVREREPSEFLRYALKETTAATRNTPKVATNRHVEQW